MRAPQNEHGAGDLAALGAADPVVLEIDGRGGTIIFAHRGDRARVVGGAQIVGEGFVAKEAGKFGLARRMRIEPGRWGRIDEFFGKRVRLGKPEPMIVAEREGHVGPLEMLDRRDDVEHAETLDPVRVVEGQAMGNASAAIMRDHLEAVVAEIGHQFGEVAGHAGLGIGGVIAGDAGLEAFAIAAQVGGDDGEPFGERRGGGMPHGMGSADYRAASGAADRSRTVRRRSAPSRT